MARTASSRVDSESALPIPNTLDTPMTPASHPPAPFPTAFTRSSSTASASRLSLNMAGLPAANVGTPSTPSATLSAFINEAPSMSTAAMLERLRTAVKQYEGQMGSLQVQLQYAEQARQELENEVVRLTRENEDITVKLAQLEATDRSNKDLNARYDTLLELLGEKTERVEELQADIADMKAAFREQVQRLTEESARR
ncbi:TATA element modulatory factor 1 TATA binding-domain-containing protein [Phlyctochytrium arcticum]|nr:TATA element modulatory factor 1 TATA binding-domain-containing protein [Phlyctochytrium arcticum]